MALSESCKEVKWLRLLLAGIDQRTVEKTTVLCDNTAAIRWASCETGMRKAKHIDVRHKFAKECVSAGIVNHIHVASEDNIADGLTKSLDRVKFEAFRAAIGVVQIDI